MKRSLTITAIVLAPLTLVVVFGLWMRYVSYDSEVSRFEARMCRDVDPAKLQAWAVNLLQQYSTAGPADNSLGRSMFPAFIQNLSSQPLSGSVLTFRDPKSAHVRITWGSGRGGHWGLRVGSTNFFVPNCEMWAPGVYFWRESERWSADSGALEIHSLPGHPTIVIYNTFAVRQPVHTAYIETEWRKRVVSIMPLQFWPVGESHWEDYKRKWVMASARTTESYWFAHYQVFWSKDGQRVAITKDGYLVAAFDWSKKRSIQWAPQNTSDALALERRIERFMDGENVW